MPLNPDELGSIVERLLEKYRVEVSHRSRGGDVWDVVAPLANEVRRWVGDQRGQSLVDRIQSAAVADPQQASEIEAAVMRLKQSAAEEVAGFIAEELKRAEGVRADDEDGWADDEDGWAEQQQQRSGGGGSGEIAFDEASFEDPKDQH